MNKCNEKKCKICINIEESRTFQSTVTDGEYLILNSFDCKSEWIIYLVTCCNCSKQYVGYTENTLRTRFTNHRRDIRNGWKTDAMAKHFIDECVNESFKVLIIDGPYGSIADLGQNETYWIKELKTYKPYGMNIYKAPSNDDHDEDVNQVTEQLAQNLNLDSHGDSGQEVQHCRFFLRGTCRYGSDCRFSHDIDISRRAPQACRYYRQGRCRNGNDCRFSH